MKDKILNKVEESFLKAEKFYGRTFERPSVEFKRNGTTAGYAWRNGKKMMFQLDLAEHHEDDFLRRTVPHEVAHIIQFNLHPRSQGHGYEWKYIMTRVMGIPAERCHSYDTSVTKTKRQTLHLYGCPCGKDFNLSQTLHNKINRGIQKRRCLSCHGYIFLKKVGNPYEQKLQAMLKQLQAKVNA